MNVGVLVSGTGTNLQALIDADISPATLACVVSNKPDVLALRRASDAGIAARVVDHKGFDSREAFEEAVRGVLLGHGVECVVLAGFMRVLTAGFIEAFPNRIINTHPALCPAFPGLHAARQALQHGVKMTGCTIHFVDAGVDTGPIIFQSAVPVLAGDDEAALQKRIQVEEHRLLPQAVKALAEGRLTVHERRVTLTEA